MPISTKPSPAAPANADETAKALRNTCNGCNPTPCCEFEVLGPAAADLIESLTTENAELRADNTSMALEWQEAHTELGQLRERLSETVRIRDAYADSARVIALWLSEFRSGSLTYDKMIAEVARRASKEIESLREQLAESQHRERAAVEAEYEFVTEINVIPSLEELDVESMESVCIVRCRKCGWNMYGDGWREENYGKGTG